MNLFSKSIAATCIALTLIGCGTIKTLKGGNDGFSRTAELWSDVPRMDGLSPSDLEPPIFVKLLMRTALNQVIGRGGNDTGDWIAFDSARTPDDVRVFYNNQRMAEAGWDPSEKSTCVSGSEYGAPDVGMVCLFVRHTSDKDIGLMIIPARAEKGGQINVWFVRVESPIDKSGPIAKHDNSNAGKNDTSSAVSDAPAPYGIDERPLPAGSRLDQLLPPTVGPYTREGLRTPTSNNLKPEQLEGPIEGSVYADYRAGSSTIFVELGIMSSVKDARDSLDVAAGDAAAGVFPTDPRFGARNREPSYLKVIDSNGAFFAWTRANYFFSAYAKDGEASLDAFMRAFPY